MRPRQDFYRVNERIRVRTVMVIDENGQQLGAMPTERARALAIEHGYDLVEVQANANPPVCRILDFGRFKYELKKKARDARKKQHVIQEKEIRIRMNIAEHDMQVKLNHAREFLSDNCKVIINMRLRGREMEHVDMARSIFDRIKKDLSDISKIDHDLRQEGNTLIIIFLPVRSKGVKRDAKDKQVDQKKVQADGQGEAPLLEIRKEPPSSGQVTQ